MLRNVRFAWSSRHMMWVAALVVVMLPGIAASQTPQGEPIASIGDGNQANKITVLAVVNGEAINRQELSQECLFRYGVEALEGMVKRQLIFNEAQRLGIHISDEDVDREIQRIATKFSLPKDRWIEVLEKERGIALDVYRQMIWMDLSLRRIAANDLKVDMVEVERLLDAEIGSQVQVRMISLTTRSRAEEVLALAKSGTEDFGRLAKEYSEDRNSAASRGMIPPIRRHVGDPNLERVVFSMAEGDISGIVEVAGQYVIVKCERLIPPRKITLEQKRAAEQNIIDYLTNRQIGEAADRLVADLQQRVQVINVYNDPELSQKYPNVAAYVDQTPITIRELSEECIARYGLEVLSGEINRRLLQQQLKSRNLVVGEADLQQEIERAAEAAGYTKTDGSVDVDAWLLHILETEGATVDLYVRDAVWPSVALKKLVNTQVSVSEEDMTKGFAANYGERVEVLAIVMQNQRLASRVWNEATENPSDEKFGELAAQYSEEPASKSNYGRVPPIAMHGGRPQLEEEAFRLKTGEISGLLNVGPSWIILKCLGRTKPIVDNPDDVRDELYQHIYEQKIRVAMQDEIQRIYAAAHIDNFLAGTTHNPEATRSARDGGALPFQPRN